MSHNYSKTQMDTNNTVAAQQLAMQQQQIQNYNDYLHKLRLEVAILPGIKSGLNSRPHRTSRSSMTR